MAVAKSESDEKSSIIRPLGHMERYQFHMLHLKFLGGTIVSCRYDIPPPLATADSHDRIVEYVEDALARVVIEHPALRLVAVKADTKRPAWVAVNQLDLAHHVQWVDCSSSSSGDEAGDGGGGDAVVSQETLRARIERCLDESYAHVKEGPQWRRDERQDLPRESPAHPQQRVRNNSNYINSTSTSTLEPHPCDPAYSKDPRAPRRKSR
ncbi:hypothetical protein NPX13_g11136 [Xylaria arbuscula]|uniref:Uncharacterized protein n=1 Tax=Xylaria arbuscula TaxID=114810 RepID=A0A9W8TGT5_9PEZI|nr:hypothetical protein NPX13_g11136 [Xylaria arbuscula]